jgi:hypothetical protein
LIKFRYQIQQINVNQEQQQTVLQQQIDRIEHHTVFSNVNRTYTPWYNQQKPDKQVINPIITKISFH